MPERTPNLHTANTAFHEEVRNRPERRGAHGIGRAASGEGKGKDVRSGPTRGHQGERPDHGGSPKARRAFARRGALQGSASRVRYLTKGR
ncbi:hypothetical protein HEK131_52460 [Streptomyces seoulensis]|nr:hypothetical protein HEK131_52460 [Streptomyces seoulensis]